MEVSFSKASYRNRLFAFGFDLMLMVVSVLFLMMGSRAIVSNSSFYKEANARINELETSSNLYAERADGNVQLMCDFYKITEESDYEKYSNLFDESLTKFYKSPLFFDQENPKSGIYIYNCLKIPEGQTSSEYFIYEDASHSKIIKKESATFKNTYDFYCNVMSKEAIKYIVNNDVYIKNSKTISLSFYFLELAVPILISSLVYELIIPLCLTRGKKTLGKLLFKLAVVDDRGLSCSWKRFVCRYLLVLFFETLLSIVTFLIPLIVSFSMFVFSKSGQSFHDYVSATFVVEGPTSSICVSEEEYIKKHEKDQKFELKKEDVAY